MGLENWTYVPLGTNPPDEYDGNEYSEALGTGDISTSPGNPGVTRIFYINYDVIPLFLDDLLGFASVDGTDITRSLPDAHPLYANMYALEASVTGVGRLTQYPQPMAKYPVAKITAVYRSPTYQIFEDDDTDNELDRYVTRQYGFGGDAITINSTGMKFVSNVGSDGNHLALSQPPARPTMTMDLTYTWHWVPANPASSPYIPPNLGPIIGCYGRINSTAFDVAHMNCPAGTVLFLGVEPKLTNYRIATGITEGNVFWEIGMKFLYRNNGHVTRGTINEQAGHNFIWDQSLQQWDLITTSGLVGGNRLYQTADLNTLFTIG